MAISIFQVEAHNMVGGHFTLDLPVGASIIDAAEEKNYKDEWVLNFYVVVDTKADWERRRFCVGPFRANLDHLGEDAALYHIISYASRADERMHVFEETHATDTGKPIRVIPHRRPPAKAKPKPAPRGAERRMANYVPGEVCISCGKDVGHGLRYCPPPCNTDLRDSNNRTIPGRYELTEEPVEEASELGVTNGVTSAGIFDRLRRG